MRGTVLLAAAFLIPGAVSRAQEASPPGDPDPLLAPADVEGAIAALKLRYRSLCAERDALEERIERLGDPEAEPGEDDDVDAEEGRAPGLGTTTRLRKQAGGSGPGGRPPGGRTPSRSPKRTRVKGPPAEEVARLEERLERVEKEIREVERLAAHYGLGSAGLLQGPEPPEPGPAEAAPPQPAAP